MRPLTLVLFLVLCVSAAHGTEVLRRLRGRLAVRPEDNIAALTRETATYVKGLSADGADAAQIMTGCYKRAVELVRGAHPTLAVRFRMDMVVAMCFYVANRYVGYIDTANSEQTDMVRWYKLIHRQATGGEFAGGGLDSTSGGGTLDSKLNDGTNNQFYHTNFFVAAGYAAAGSLRHQALVSSGNVWHEVVDGAFNGGASVEDYFASAIGQTGGRALWDARTRNKEYMDLLIPAYINGIVSVAGTRPPRCSGTPDSVYDAAVKVSDALSEYRDSTTVDLLLQKNPGTVLIHLASITSSVLSWLGGFFD